MDDYLRDIASHVARNRVLDTAVNRAGHDFGNGHAVPKLDSSNEVAVYIKS